MSLDRDIAATNDQPTTPSSAAGHASVAATTRSAAVAHGDSLRALSPATDRAMDALLRECGRGGGDDEVFLARALQGIEHSRHLGVRSDLLAQGLGLLLLVVSLGLSLALLDALPGMRDHLPGICIGIGLLIFVAAPWWRPLESPVRRIVGLANHLSADIWVYRTCGALLVLCGNLLAVLQ
jgi:hypothetical protein